jgi:hypothetical protein
MLVFSFMALAQVVSAPWSDTVCAVSADPSCYSLFVTHDDLHPVITRRTSALSLITLRPRRLRRQQRTMMAHGAILSAISIEFISETSVGCEMMRIKQLCALPLWHNSQSTVSGVLLGSM